MSASIPLSASNGEISACLPHFNKQYTDKEKIISIVVFLYAYIAFFFTFQYGTGRWIDNNKPTALSRLSNISRKLG